MDLQLKPHSKNLFPLRAILIKGESVAEWIRDIQNLQITSQQVDIFPIPGLVANSVWGCMLVPFGKIEVPEIGKNEWCQMLAPNFFIADKSVLSPSISTAEIEKLFSTKMHVFHPSFGLAELHEKLDLINLIATPAMENITITKPKSATFIPQQINSFQIQAAPPEEVMRNMEEKAFPKAEEMKDEPLSLFEKVKLALYKTLFGIGKAINVNGNNETGTNTNTTDKPSWWNKATNFLRSKMNLENKFTKKLQQDFEELEKRNRKQLDKLMDLLKNNPEEALKYAIPLDEGGSTRGGNEGEFNLMKRWSNWSLFGNSSSLSSSGTVNLGDNYHELRKQYQATAEALIAKKEYHKAAFVYMKLLKDYYSAAKALEAGMFYQEAATIYLKHANDKTKAAVCFEKGNMISNAIDIYKELNENEKVGDLYVGIHKRKEADFYYEKVVEAYRTNSQFVKAALLYKNKMDNSQGGQSLLLEGWRSNKDAFNCLNNYFANINDVKVLKTELDSIYTKDVSQQNREVFLQVIKHEYEKGNELAEPIKDMAYEVVAAQIAINPNIVKELKAFNTNNKQLVKDTIRFVLNQKKI